MNIQSIQLAPDVPALPLYKLRTSSDPSDRSDRGNPPALTRLTPLFTSKIENQNSKMRSKRPFSKHFKAFQRKILQVKSDLRVAARRKPVKPSQTWSNQIQPLPPLPGKQSGKETVKFCRVRNLANLTILNTV
jgi:hypothetical protein